MGFILSDVEDFYLHLKGENERVKLNIIQFIKKFKINFTFTFKIYGQSFNKSFIPVKKSREDQLLHC